MHMNYRIPTTKNFKQWAVISPSYSPIRNQASIELLKIAQQRAQRMNIVLEFMDNWDKTNGKEGGNIKEKNNDLIQACNTKSGIIISSNGGRGVMAMLNNSLIAQIGQSQKWICGMSDTTTLLNAVAYKEKLITIYGIDLLWGLGKFLTDKNAETFEKIVESGSFHFLNSFYLTNIVKGLKQPRGRIMGGCLTSFCYLLGTQFDPTSLINEPFILVLEDIFQSLGDIEDKFYQLKLNHNFASKCNGLILGNFLSDNSNESNKKVQEKAIKVFQDCEIPIFVSTEIGHGVSNIPIPIGGMLEIQNRNTHWSV